MKIELILPNSSRMSDENKFPRPTRDIVMDRIKALDREFSYLSLKEVQAEWDNIYALGPMVDLPTRGLKMMSDLKSKIREHQLLIEFIN